MTGPILRIAVPSPLYQTFDYLPPLEGDPATLQPGVRVRIPFGRRQTVGFLIALGTDSELNPALLRPALAVLDREPILPVDVLALIQWAWRYYHHPPGEAFATALPVLLRQGEPAVVPQPPSLWRITPAGRTALAESVALRRAPIQRRLLDHLAQCPAGLDAETLRPLVRDSATTLRALHAKTGWNPARRMRHRRPKPRRPFPLLHSRRVWPKPTQSRQSARNWTAFRSFCWRASLAVAKPRFICA